MRNFVTKVNDTAPLSSGVLDAAEDNARFEELETAVTVSGIMLDDAGGPDTRTDMLAESMTRHVGAALACSDSGVANAYVLTAIGEYVAPTALIAEMRLRFRPGHANTSSSTLNALGLGIRPLVDHALSPLSGGELEVGREAEVMFRTDVGGSGSWVLPAWANALYVDPSPVAPTSIGDGEGWSVNTGSNTGNLNFPGLTNSATLASTDIFARHVAGVGHKGITGAQLIAALSVGGGLKGLQLITTSGTYTKTSGTVQALVIAVGGGGGGGGYPSVSSDGGGGGGMALSLVDLSATSTVACTIGAGGAGGAGGIGTAGGSTSFGGLVVAAGGAGGSNNQIDAGTPGGAGTTGLLKMSGCAGGNANTRMGGVGGGAFFGGGGIGGTYNSVRTGGNGGGYGGGGGGGSWGNGGAGAPGCIFVLEFA